LFSAGILSYRIASLLLACLALDCMLSLHGMLWYDLFLALMASLQCDAW
jgi:hypothetical protein